jgi:hypothetical protein
MHVNPVFCAPLVAVHVMRGGKALITVHDQMLAQRLSRAMPHERLAFRWMVKSPNVRWIAVSCTIQEILQQEEVPRDHIRVVPAFLMPSEGDMGGALPVAVRMFVDGREPTMVVYGYERLLFGGKDLYGFDFAIRVLGEVLRTAPNAGLVILCPGASQDPEIWKPLMEEVGSRGLSRHVLFQFEPLEDPVALWQRCSIMLRPTVTDGDSVAVREMIGLGLPVVASDAAGRPDGVKVLSLRSPGEWARLVLELVNRNAGLSKSRIAQRDGYAEVKRILAELGGMASESRMSRPSG